MNFELENLPNLDTNSKTDAFCVLWHLKGKSLTKVKLGQTETVENSLDPVFVAAIEADFFFEENHKFLVEVFDVDDATSTQNLAKQEFVGSHSFTLHQVINAREKYQAPLENPVRRLASTVNILAQEKKADFGKFAISFKVESSVDSTANLFYTIS